MKGGVLVTAGVVGKSPFRPCSHLEAKHKLVGGFSIRCTKALGRGVPDVKGYSPGRRRSIVALQSVWTNAWQHWRMCSKSLTTLVPAAGRGDHHGPLIVDDLGGQYEETFNDVEKDLLDYFTYKAVRTVLAQLSEMNPQQYAWFYNFLVNNKPQDSKVFIRLLVKERQEVGERVMVTRLHLFNKWVKKYNHAQLYKAISDQNLELLRERLIETVKFTNSVGDDMETTQ